MLASYALFARTNENRHIFLHAVSWDTYMASKSTAPAFYKTSLFKCHVMFLFRRLFRAGNGTKPYGVHFVKANKPYMHIQIKLMK